MRSNLPAAGQATITAAPRLETEAKYRPLEMKLILRLLGFMRPYAKKRNRLLVVVLLRSVQLPLLAWLLAEVIQIPVADHDVRTVYLAAAAYLGLALFTSLTLHFRDGPLEVAPLDGVQRKPRPVAPTKRPVAPPPQDDLFG